MDILRITICIVVCLFYTQKVEAQVRPESPKTVYTSVGSAAELPCRVGDTTLSPWQFQHGGSELRSRIDTYNYLSSSIVTLAISDVQASDAGDFSCVISGGMSTTRLVVLELSPPQVVRLKGVKPTEVTVTWTAPLKSATQVRGYNIYVTAAGPGASPSKISVDKVSPNMKESFLLYNMTSGTRYSVQLSAKYPVGDATQKKTIEGPMSHAESVLIPFPPGNEYKAQNVHVQPWRNGTILVTWQMASLSDTSSLLGFKVSYQSERTKGGEVMITSSVNGEGQDWQAVLENLPTRKRYNIQVRPILKDFEGPRSAPITFRHDGFPSELSIRAVALGPETVLVTYGVLGYGRLSKLRILYSDDTATKWTRVKARNVKTKERYAILTDLQPASTYFFAVRARVGKKSMEAVTNIVTPPSELAAPTEVKLTELSGGKVKVEWSHKASRDVKWCRVKVEEKQADDSYRLFQDTSTPQGVTSTIITSLSDDREYRVKVTPFDLQGPGETSDPVNFDLVTLRSGLGISGKASPPVFEPQPQPRLTVTKGENIELMCRATGNPTPTIRWFSDGIQLGSPSLGKHVLQIEQVETMMDVVCRADNVAGVVSAFTRIEVKEHVVETKTPEFDPDHQLLSEYGVRQGDRLEIECVATGEPTPTVEWFLFGDEKYGDSAEGRNTLVLDDVWDEFELTCRAENTAGVKLAKTQVKILQAPVFTADRSIRIAQAGEDVKVPCIFSGYPVPNVTALQDGNRLGSGAGYYVASLTKLQETVVVTCKADGLNGLTITEDITVQVEQPDKSTPPTFTLELSPRVNVSAGGRLELVCSAEGEPTPEVQWSSDGGRFGEVSIGENKLVVEAVEKDTVLVCRASNKAGAQVTYTLVTVLRPAEDPVPVKPTEPFNVGAYILPGDDNKVLVRWTVERGNLTAIRGFKVYLFDEHGGSIEQQFLEGDKRNASVGPITDKQGQKITVHTITDVGIVAENELLLVILPSSEVDANTAVGDGEMHIDVLEVRDTQALIEIGVTPSDLRVRYFRVRVRDAVGGRQQRTLYSYRVRPRSPSVVVTKLESVTPYEVIVDAFTFGKKKPILTKSVTFMTGPPGLSGHPVLSTVTARHLSQSAHQGEEPTTEATPTSDSGLTMTTVGAADVEIVARNYSLGLRMVYRTSHKTRISWAVNKGELTNIESFHVKLETTSGEKVLEREYESHHRSLTVTSLYPTKSYIVTLRALDADNTELVQKQLELIPVSALELTETNGPRIYLQANEIRSDRVQLEWIIRGIEIEDVKFFKVRIQDSDVDGVELLSKTLTGDSVSLGLEYLLSNRRFFVTVDVLGDENLLLLRETVTFETPGPDEEGEPVSGTLQDVGLAVPTSEPNRDESWKGTKRPLPVLKLKLKNIGEGKLQVSWDLENEVSGDLNDIQVLVRNQGRNGLVILEKDSLPLYNAFFDIHGLFPDSHYFIELHAMSSNGSQVMSVGVLYSPSSSPDLVEVTSSGDSSNEQQLSTVAEAKPTELPQPSPGINSPKDQSPLSIGSITTTDKTAKISWFIQDNAQVTGSHGTMVRYVPIYKGRQEDKFMLKFVSVGLTEVTITRLQPDTTYSFQVAAVIGTDQNWSEQKMATTNHDL